MNQLLFFIQSSAPLCCLKRPNLNDTFTTNHSAQTDLDCVYKRRNSLEESQDISQNGETSEPLRNSVKHDPKMPVKISARVNSSFTNTAIIIKKNSPIHNLQLL